jgi:hypothetical protein
VGSARAAKVASSWFELVLFITFKFYNLMVILGRDPMNCQGPKEIFLATKIHNATNPELRVSTPRTTYDLGGA